MLHDYYGHAVPRAFPNYRSDKYYSGIWSLLVGSDSNDYIPYKSLAGNILPDICFILQQVDGNIIGPKILGDSTGL